MKARTRKSFQAASETLEVRQLPAASSVFVLDYTPDYRSMGSLHETFYNVRFANGSTPTMFDFDGNGRLTANDVTVAADQITSRVRGYFANYLSSTPLSIIAGDLNANSNQLLGDQWLRYGLRTNAANVSVMYFGGRSAGGEYGRAPLARDGYNVEGFGEVYVRTIAIDLINRNPRTTPTEFAISVASTTAHELGHMMGLRHATSGPATNLMVPGRGRASNYFPNQATYTEGGGPQNAHHELWYSLRGQPTYYQVVSYGLPDPAMDHDHEHDHEHHAAHDDDALHADDALLMTEEEAMHHTGALPAVQESDRTALTSVDAFFANYDDGARKSSTQSTPRSTVDSRRQLDNSLSVAATTRSDSRTVFRTQRHDAAQNAVAAEQSERRRESHEQEPRVEPTRVTPDKPQSRRSLIERVRQAVRGRKVEASASTSIKLSALNPAIEQRTA